jgi:signal-transduction protein with cAMP-binding, CBS, and nucleotidyltransferase domain
MFDLYQYHDKSAQDDESVTTENIMQTVAHILQAKDDATVHVISPYATVLDAIKQMAEHDVGALLVVDAGRIIGIVSERDYARKIVLKGRASDTTTVSEIMTSPVMTVHPSQTNEECMALMTENRFRHLPVMKDGNLIGIISIGDLVKDIISEQQFTIRQLEYYISGARA